MDRLTHFPALTGDDGAARALLPCRVENQPLSIELIALSWAHLLRSFTTEPSPVFLLNGAPVKADLIARKIQPATLDAAAELSANHTSVVTEDLSSEGCSGSCVLTWNLNPSTQMSTLHSTTGMDAAFLHELGTQLMHTVREQAAKSGMQVELSAHKLPALSVSNPSPVTLPGPQLLHKLALSSAHDSHPAIEFMGADGNVHDLSYCSLDRLSSKLAAEIAAASAPQRNGTRKLVVPVLLPQSLDLYITWLGILKAGGAFCPLNIDAPPDRIEFILQDVAASVVVTLGALAARVPRHESLTVINVDVIETSKVEISVPAVENSPSDLAYVMYTSGSTGRPKGVGVSHLAATQSLLAHNDLIPHFNRFLQFASPTFDVSVFEVFFPLMRGATLIGSEREQMLLDIGHVMTEMDVDAAELTPTVAGELLRSRAAAPSLRVLLTIGEMLTKHVVDEFGQSQDSAGILHGMYGPTEAAIHCTAATHFSTISRVNLIGKPFKTVSAFIMSMDPAEVSSCQESQILPLGQVGELVVGGPQLADGYINRPEENAKAFIESPQYGRLYRTGDKARMLPTGEIECFGRISSGQVKLRGQRIELGEIEHVVCKASIVRGAVAVVSGGSLAAFVLVSDKGVTDRELRDICRRWLPRFMVPGEFIIVERFPQLPSGKVDRKALEADFVRHRSAPQSVDGQNFRDETEELIASCIADVLGRHLSPQESLVAAGLDSLAAIRLASHLLEAGIRMDVARLLEADCVDGIWQFAQELNTTQGTKDRQAALERIRQLVSDAGASRVESLGLSSHVTGIEPCSHIQQAMILETIRHTKAYCNWVELEFHRSQSIGSPAVQKSFITLFEQNPLLRSGFVEIGLKDHSYARIIWRTIDEQLIQRREEFDYNLCLTEGQDLLHPLRIQFMETADTLRILVHIHHALYDGWSWQLMLNDLHRILLGEELPPRPAYNVVTDFFTEHKLAGSANESANFWRDHLQGASGATFPNFHGKTDIPRSTQEVTRALNVSVSRLNDVTQRLKVSRQTIFQAAYCYVLSSYLGLDNVVFGTVFSGRTLPVKGIETVLGPCIRTLPTRMDLGKIQDVTDLLFAIQNMNRKSLEHGSLPLQDIKKASGIDLHLDLFDTAIVWQESIWLDDDHYNLFREVGAAEFLEFALLLGFEPRNDQIHAKITYENSILPREQARLLLEQIDSVASILIRFPELSIHDIGSHLPQSNLSVCNEIFETQHDLPSLVFGVEQVASIDHARTAIQLISPVGTGGAKMNIESISYGNLNARANRFARHLLRTGVSKGDLTAISMENSFESHIALLALAKIGAGVLPISPGASLQTIGAIRDAVKPQFCIVGQDDVRLAFESVPQIHLSKLSDDFDDHNLNENTEGFHIVCTESDGQANYIHLSHHSLQSHINAFADSYPVSAGSKLLQTSPHASTGFIVDSFFAWHNGMTLCSASDDLVATNIQDVVNSVKATHLHLTPTLASRLSPAGLPNVQCVITAGEYPMVKVHRDWVGKGLYQGYSDPTLTGIYTLLRDVTPSTSHANIGKPLRNTSVMIVAEQEPFMLLPRGAAGELCFGGDQIARIIPESEQSNIGRFVYHAQFGRIFRTGDHARLLPDGSIMLLQRREQTTLHGQRIDLDEINRAIISSELVQNAVSIVWNNPAISRQHLITLWVPSEHCWESMQSQLETIAQRLYEDVSTRLPSFTIPSLLVPGEIPMNESHKTDFTRIGQIFEQLDPRQLEIFSRKPYTEDVDGRLTDVEQAIAGALSAVTGIDQQAIRRHTSFYKLGIDSLSAISLSRKLREFGFGRLAVSTILRHSTIAQLATVVSNSINGQQLQEATLEESLSVFDESFLGEIEEQFRADGMPIKRVHPCTPLQEAMLAAETDTGSAYFNHVLLRVNTEVEALKTAWERMLQRHDILRTCFRPTSDKRFAYAQVVLDEAALPWSFVETSCRLDQDVGNRKSEFECRSPVNGKLPYSLTVFADTATHSQHLLLSIHHALYDGEGIAQLLQEVQISLAGEQVPQTTPFHRFIEYMLSTSPDSSDQFWDRYLSGVPPTLLSNPEALRSVNQSASQQASADLGISLESFKRQCKDLSVTPLNVFHASWARLLALHAGSSDVCFGNVFSCRTIPLEGADRIVGPCFNTLPMRVKFSATSTNADILKSAQTHNSDILPHQLSPLRRIQRRILNDGSRLFDTLVILQSHKSELDSRYWELVEDEGNMGFPLICEIIPAETHNNIRVCLHFQTSHITHVVAERLAQDFVALVRHTAQFPFAQASDKRPIGSVVLQIFEKPGCRQANHIGPTAQVLPTRPWSYQEAALRDVICKISGVDADVVLLSTTIFQLGLDSINAVQISGTLRKLGYKISAGDILEAASIDKISLLLVSSEKGAHDDQFDFAPFENQHLQHICDQLEISSQTVQALRPCTPVQNGMLALFNHSGGKMYFNRMALKSSLPLDKVALKKAWLKVVSRHEMLRTGFVQLRDNKYPFAMITYQAGLDIPWYEMSEPAAMRSDVQEKQALEELHRPPWRITVESCDKITTMHFSALHAIYDAQSLATIFSDVMAAYEGGQIPIPAPIAATLGPILTESQRQAGNGQDFWQSLATEVHPSKFPDLNPVRTQHKGLLETSIRCSLNLATLEGRCRELGVTLQAAGQAAWARVLAAYTGEPNVVFGTVLSGRNLSSSAQDAVFPCLVTVPLPACTEGTNLELLKRTLQRNSSLIKNQFTPLAQIQRWLGSDEPLFDTLFVYQKFSTNSTVPDAWEVVDEETRIDFPISIELVPHSTYLDIRVTHRSDLVPKEQAITLLDQYDKLLEQTVLSPDSDADDFLFLGDRLLSVTPAKEKAIATSASLLHQFVEQNAQAIPEKTAFEFASGPTADNLQKKSWSYRELNGDGNRVAHFLQRKGVLPGAMVAICFDKCPEASIAILGILKAGCAYLAIDPGAPISRKQFILEDSGAKILLCNQLTKVELEDLLGVEIETLDKPGLLEDMSSAQPVLQREIRPDDTCYCLYTSGTTGTPKGCEITHDNAVQAMLAFQRLFSPHWDEDSRWLQFASFHFDVSVLEQYWSWSVGICVTSCPRDLLFEDLPGTIRKLQITHIDLTPSLARLIHPDEVPSLCRGVFITGGEALKQEILDAWGEHGVIYNGYGPTEVTIGCTMLPRMRSNDKPSNIGPQFDNVGSYVFCPGTSTPVIRGGLGELCVSGPLVGKGYLNRPELTGERFQVVPENGDRIYRTGDLVRILHDGSFQFLGRIDDQVKLRGQRLEIGEINEVIKQATPELNEVATLVIKHPKQSKDQLVSFITRSGLDQRPRSVEVSFSENDRILLSTIKSACHTYLPGYMVPTHFILLARFPLSPNNKADMKVLKELYQELSLEDLQKLTSLSVEHSVKSKDEEKIVSVLAEFIGSPESALSSWSSIYELGLDSISVISFSRSLRESGFSQAQPSLIMKHPTIADMASALETSSSSLSPKENLHGNAKQAIEAFAHKHSHSVTETIGALSSDVEQIAPCTPLQEGIIYQFLSSSEPLYCSSFTFELNNSVELARLQAAWDQAQRQVQILRARFSPTPDGYAQAILKTDKLPWFNLSAASVEDLDTVQKQQLERWISGLEDLSARLWEVGVVQSPVRSVMCLNIFHALYDGNSLALLLELVAQCYLEPKAALQKRPDFLEILHLGPLCRNPSEEAFWKEHLADCERRSVVLSGHDSSSSIVETIQIDTTRHLNSLRKALNVTEQAILHACWLLTLQQHYSFVPPIGVVVSGRTIDVPGIADVIGPLFNTIPSNVQLHDIKTRSEVAHRCHEFHVSTMPFQYSALRDIVKCLGRNPDERLFDSLFVFQREIGKSESSTVALWRSLDSEAQLDYPLALEILRRGNESLTVTLAAKSHVLSREGVRHVLSRFQRVLSDFAENCEQELPFFNGPDGTNQTQTNGDIKASRVSFDSSDNSHETPFLWTPQARTLRDVVATLAGVEAHSINEDTSIFEVGLDSIDAIKLSSRLGSSGIKIPVSVIMRQRTIRSMAKQIVPIQTKGQNAACPLLGQMERGLTNFLERENLVPPGACRILPATPIQEAMIAEMFASKYQRYYNHEILQIEPHVELERLLEAWKAVVRTHPILRTSFVEVWDPAISVSYAQVVHKEETIDFQTVQLNGEPVVSIVEAQRARARTKLAGQPLLSVTAAMEGDARYLVLSIAHALYDGWSISLLHEDVARSYSGEDCTRPRPDAILEHIIAASGERALAFWKAMLSNCTPVAFPSGMDARTNSMAVYRAEESLSVCSEKAEAFCRRHGITMQGLLVSCWSLVLATYVKKLDVVFGLVLSGRNVSDSDNVMFPTMNTVAMRVILHGTRLELVKYVQETLLEMSEHQHFPLRRVRADSGPRRLFDTLFVYQKRPSEETDTKPVLYKPTGGASDVEYPVSAEVEAVGPDLVGRIACRASVLGENATHALLTRMADVLSSLIDDPGEQTIKFTADGMSICGSSIVQDETKQPPENGTEQEVPNEEDWNSVERKIRNVLSVVSGIPEESINKKVNIFQLGLDSISAIKVTALLKRQSVRLAVSDMLRAGTIDRMASAVNTNQTDITSAEISNALEESLENIDLKPLLQSYAIDRQNARIIIPATAGQTYFLSMHTLNPAVFYPEFFYLASSQLNRDVLANAWARLTEQTPVLRTAFIPTGTLERMPYVQVILNTVNSFVRWHETVDNLVAAKAKQPFGSVPVTLHACQTSEGTVLVLHIHHALYDAVSLPSMIDRLAQLCSQATSESRSELDDLSKLVAYQHIHSPLDVRRQFWLGYLAQTSTTGSEDDQVGRFGAIQQYFRPGLVSNMSHVERAAQREGLSVQSVFMAAFARAHAQFLAAAGTSKEELHRQLVVGLYLANRSLDSGTLSKLTAPTVNIVPLRLDDKLSDAHGSLFTAAQKIQDDINRISMAEHCSVSLIEIAEWTGVRISICVNFLRLPQLDNAISGTSDRVVIKPIQREDLAASETSSCDSQVQSTANGHAVTSNSTLDLRYSTSSAAMGDVFMPTLDVEAAIRDDKLDFGLFGPESRLDDHTAEQMFELMQQEMTALLEGSR